MKSLKSFTSPAELGRELLSPFFIESDCSFVAHIKFIFAWAEDHDGDFR
jgi:hypothetical protein